MNLEVTSVSKRAEKLSETPSAIQVVTGEDIRNYGATNIPEALYLAGNLQIAQKGAHSWAVSSRGFNTDLGNKLLVLIDGRTVYTPLFSGVFWERQDYLLEDLSQIEVISGPGGTLWGANAVNGVINILSKSAKDTQGVFAAAAAGNELRAQGSVRYGSKIGSNTYYRIYGKYADRDAITYADSIETLDKWGMGQGGFRIDSDLSTSDQLTVQGDYYKLNDLLDNYDYEVQGGNVLARWTHRFADSSDVKFQTYLDRTYLSLPTAPFMINGIELAPAGLFEDDLTTFDIELQHRFQLGRFNRFVWGLGYRNLHDETTNSPGLGFLPSLLKQDLYNFFVQDEIQVLKNLRWTIGTKLEHNAYVGGVYEPSTRIAWNVTPRHMIWGALSRAVRTPSRIDRDLSQGTPPFFVLLRGDSNFVSEILIASELGFRSQWGDKATTSLSLFYNDYDNIRSTELDPVTIFPLFFQNGLEGETQGYEASITYRINERWQLFASYYRLIESLRVKEGKSDFNNTFNEVADPGWQFNLRSSVQLPFGLSVNAAFRWVDDLDINDSGVQRVTPSYAELDGRIAWSINNHFELSVAGRNLLHKEHVEYGAPGPNLQAIQRSIFGKFIVRF